MYGFYGSWCSSKKKDLQLQFDQKPESVLENYSNELFNTIKEGKENNAWEQLGVGKKAIDCYKLDPNQCLQYANCGLCIKGKERTCVPGDEQGAFFKDDCQAWEYANRYDGYIFGEVRTSVTAPWNTFYPDYEARLPSPISGAALR
jgi:hypothetical protein